MKLDLRGPKTLSQIIDFTFRVYSANFVRLFSIALIVAPLQMLSVVAQRQINDQATAQGVAALLNVPVALVGLIATGAIVAAVDDLSGGTPPAFGRALDAAFARFVDLLLTALLAAALVALAALSWPWLALWWLIRRDATIDGARNWWLVAIPFALPVYLAVRWVFATQGVMLEGGRNWRALDASATVVRGRWWRTLGILVVVGLIEGAALGMGAVGAFAPPVIDAVLTGALVALVLPFAGTAQTFLYYDEKARSYVDRRTDQLPTA
ncbi:MAG TPA: hypothetical protein VFC53_10850 [Dehalococcoidia bacterium]|nr:hypothetical protein [Dehalococcoidia bacterium]